MRSPHAELTWLGCATLLLASLGCAGYQLGNQSLFRPEIRTVYIPVFESVSYRRYLGEQLTEAVIKEIERQTPYKVVATPNADSVLMGRVIDEKKRVISETINDDPRYLGTDLVVSVTWQDRRGGVLMQQSGLVLSPLTFFSSDSGDLIPEGGQSLGTAQQETIQRIARQIVEQMEVRW
jgi:hypothetical protein